MTETGGLGVGRALAEARQAQGLAIADVAQQLKFMPRQIEALEAERFASLPGPTIARGMVRSYARLLKLEPEPLLKLMEGRVAVPESGPQLGVRRGEPVPASDGGRRSTAIYLALSAAVLVVAGAAVYEWRHERPVQPFVTAGEPRAASDAPGASEAPARREVPAQPPSVPGSVAKKAEAEAEPAPPQPRPVKPKALAAEPPKPKPLAVEEVKPEPHTPVVQAKSAGPALAEAPAAATAVSAVNRLAFKFDEEAWVEVIDSQGRRLISSLNAAGTERSVRARPPINVVIGNAQHVRVTYNGREIDLKPHIRVEVARFTIE